MIVGDQIKLRECIEDIAERNSLEDIEKQFETITEMVFDTEDEEEDDEDCDNEDEDTEDEDEEDE